MRPETRRGTSRVAAASVALVALASCDWTWTLDARITVPEGARAAADAPPHVLFLEFDGGTHVAAVICDEPGGDLAFATRVGGIGGVLVSGPHATATAWLEPKPAGLDLACGSYGWAEWVSEPSGPRPGAWRASAEAFEREGNQEGVVLVLAPAP